jgi:hypothetical protein
MSPPRAAFAAAALLAAGALALRRRARRHARDAEAGAAAGCLQAVRFAPPQDLTAALPPASPIKSRDGSSAGAAGLQHAWLRACPQSHGLLLLLLAGALLTAAVLLCCARGAADLALLIVLAWAVQLKARGRRRAPQGGTSSGCVAGHAPAAAWTRLRLDDH